MNHENLKLKLFLSIWERASASALNKAGAFFPKSFNFPDTKYSILNTNRRGFTLVEVLVASTLFLAAVTLASGVLLSVLRGQNQAIKTASVMSATGLAVEQIAREARTGFGFRSTAEPNATLTFVNDDNVLVIYRHNQTDGTLEKSEGAGGFRVITPADVNVVSVAFVLFGNNSGDGYPPRITIRLIVATRDPRLTGLISILQTTVSSRTLDS